MKIHSQDVTNIKSIGIFKPWLFCVIWGRWLNYSVCWLTWVTPSVGVVVSRGCCSWCWIGRWVVCVGVDGNALGVDQVRHFDPHEKQGHAEVVGVGEGVHGHHFNRDERVALERRKKEYRFSGVHILGTTTQQTNDWSCWEALCLAKQWSPDQNLSLKIFGQTILHLLT